MDLAASLGLTGTPMSITETGERINGYVSAKTLLQQLEAAIKGEE
jgi:protein-disulfide isomerase